MMLIIIFLFTGRCVSLDMTYTASPKQSFKTSDGDRDESNNGEKSFGKNCQMEIATPTSSAPKQLAGNNNNTPIRENTLYDLRKHTPTSLKLEKCCCLIT